MGLLRLFMKVLLVISFSVSVCFAVEKSNNGSDQLDEQDQQEFNVRIDRANACTRLRDFACSEKQLGQAKKYANGSRDRGILKKAMENLELQRQLALRDDAKRKYSSERSSVEENAENIEKELAASRRASVASANAENRRADAAMERQQVKNQQSVSAYKAQLFGNLQNDINRSWAQAEAGSRGSSIEEDRAKAKRLAEFNDNISQMEADPNSDLNRDKRAREREREKDRDASQRADSERAAKRDASKKVALANDAKRTSDERAQAKAEATTREKQKADELKSQQEREKQRANAERRSQELRDTAERKRVAAAEEAKRKAEKEREAQAEKQARVQYLQSVTAGTRLVATKCPDGEGKYYATGTRPKIKPEVVGCVDVRFRAYCPGSRQYSEGLAHNFIGMAGCFGDTYDINPKPACKVEQVRIEVVETRECSK